MVKLEVKKGEADSFIISKETANQLGIENGDVVLVKNPTTQRGVGSLAEIDDSQPSGVVQMNDLFYEAIGVDEGFEVDLNPYEEDFSSVTNVEFGIEPTAGANDVEDPLAVVKENEEKFLQFLDNRVFNNNSQYYWEEKGLLVSVKSTDPELEGNELARFGDMKEYACSWSGSELKPFDGVLLIDVSGSMETEDMNMEEIDWAIERMSKSLSGPFCNQFLDRLKGRDEIKRYEGAAMCALLYLVQKVGRGVGDNVGVGIFSKEPEIIKFQDKNYFSSGVGDPSSAAENIVQKIEKSAHEHTNMAGALEEAIDAMKNFERKKMKMIVLLTDGKPFPERVNSAEDVKEIVDTRLQPRKDIIINTIGLGGEVNHDLLDYIAQQTGGKYTHVDSLQELTEAYSKYAREISVSGSA